MRARLLLLPVLLLALGTARTAYATGQISSPDFEFSFTSSPTTGSTIIPDNNVVTFMLPQTMLNVDPTSPINFLELEITGLSHDAPQDLNLTLLDPSGLKVGQFGSGVVVMENVGSDFAINNTTLLFSDKGVLLPMTAGDGALQPFPDTIYQPLGPGSFSNFIGVPVGTAPWVVVFSDDALGREGSFVSVTLRGTVVPEPATLTLLALGAIVTFRRRRRQ